MVQAKAADSRTLKWMYKEYHPADEYCTYKPKKYLLA